MFFVITAYKENIHDISYLLFFENVIILVLSVKATISP